MSNSSMKLFRTSSKDVINECCSYFNFKLPSEILPARFDRFIFMLKCCNGALSYGGPSYGGLSYDEHESRKTVLELRYRLACTAHVTSRLNIRKT